MITFWIWFIFIHKPHIYSCFQSSSHWTYYNKRIFTKFVCSSLFIWPFEILIGATEFMQLWTRLKVVMSNWQELSKYLNIYWWTSLAVTFGRGKTLSSTLNDLKIAFQTTPNVLCLISFTAIRGLCNSDPVLKSKDTF